VSDHRALRREELALGALGLTAALLVLVVAVDTIHFHGFALEPQLAIALLDAVVIARALASLARRLRAERAFVRGLPVLGLRTVHGHDVHVLPGRELVAFCAGLRTPAVYVSEGTLRTAGKAELRAILAHEEHHRRRRDPLRLLLAHVVADALRPLPPFATLADREAALADLAADAASVDALGDRRPLAAAFLRFSTVAPERVDRLVRTAPAATVPLVLLAVASAALAAIAVCIGPMQVAGWHPHGPLSHLFETLAPALLLVPACLAARRAEACLRPLP
jgi:peptidase M48-like protein